MHLRYTVDNKRIFTRPDGQEIVDLTQQNFNPGSNQKIYDIIIISKDFAGRPDLVAKLAYQDVNAVDLILKSNGISNPFSIDEYDIFFIQEKNAIISQFTSTRSKQATEIVRNQYLDETKTPEKDLNLKKFEERKKKGLPPNFAKEGDKEIKLRGGKVIFGEDVAGNKAVCKEMPLSKSELLKRLTKNRLKNGGK